VVAGLPLAVSIFAALVTEWDYDPEELLAGDMVHHGRLRTWFEEVTSRIDDEARDLLAVLSLTVRPFTRALARALAHTVRVTHADGIIDTLHKSFLLTRYGGNRWSVHRLLAQLAQATLSVERRTAGLRAIARCYRDGVAPPLRRLHTREDFSA